MIHKFYGYIQRIYSADEITSAGGSNSWNTAKWISYSRKVTIRTSKTWYFVWPTTVLSFLYHCTSHFVISGDQPYQLIVHPFWGWNLGVLIYHFWWHLRWTQAIGKMNEWKVTTLLQLRWKMTQICCVWKIFGVKVDRLTNCCVKIYVWTITLKHWHQVMIIISLWIRFNSRILLDQWDWLLTHWGRDKMAAIFQTTIANAFSWMKMYEFRLRFHWILFPGVQLTIFQHWFR